jgi:chemotaxis regulatin CheY-phosphate phosphatase CheZ
MTRDYSFVDVERLYRDCRDLARYIADARREIAALRPAEIKQSKLPRAGQELDAIVQATESATNTIMEAAEEIMSGDPSDAETYKAHVDDACMRIFEACSFQDITGQRISKVVETIEYVEERLDTLQKAWGPDVIEEPEAEPEQDADKALLNGPALEGEGIGQTDVDAILGEPHADTDSKKKDEPVNQADIDALFD